MKKYYSNCIKNFRFKNIFLHYYEKKYIFTMKAFLKDISALILLEKKNYQILQRFKNSVNKKYFHKFIIISKA